MRTVTRRVIDMMTLDEIEVALKNKHGVEKEWLEALKELKDQRKADRMNELEKRLFAEPYVHYASFNKGYNKAIDDFAEKVIQRYHELPTTLGYTEEIVKEMAEQLKAGEQNDR